MKRRSLRLRLSKAAAGGDESRSRRVRRLSQSPMSQKTSRPFEFKAPADARHLHRSLLCRPKDLLSAHLSGHPALRSTVRGDRETALGRHRARR